jgi:hypothetical protein
VGLQASESILGSRLWSVVLCCTLQRIPLVCCLRCAEYVSREVGFVLSVMLLVGVTNIWNVLCRSHQYMECSLSESPIYGMFFVGVTNIWKYCMVVWSDNYSTNIYIDI